MSNPKRKVKDEDWQGWVSISDQDIERAISIDIDVAEHLENVPNLCEGDGEDHV